jgi:hypothetical protein
MLIKSTLLTYAFCLIMSRGRKNFTNLDRENRINSKKIIQSADTILRTLQELCQLLFRDAKKLFLIVDDTLIKKIYSQWMQGSGKFYDTKTGICITSFNLFVGAISDGKNAIPISASYFFPKELLEAANLKPQSKDDFVKALVDLAKKLFPSIKLILVADGLYSTKNLLVWCAENKINAEMRMRSSCVVLYKGKKMSLKKLVLERNIAPKGRQMCRTVTVQWHNIDLEVTIVRRIDKHGNESIVFQAATYKDRPDVHVKHYQQRWPIEMIFRTTKQSLGLQECQSRSLQTQHNHVASVLLAYAIAQLEMKRRKLDTPEKAIQASRASEQRNRYSKKGAFAFLNHNYLVAMA